MPRCMTCQNIRRGRRWDRHPGRGTSGPLTATAAPEGSLTTTRPHKLLHLLPPIICQFLDRGWSTDLRILPRIQRRISRQEHKKSVSAVCLLRVSSVLLLILVHFGRCNYRSQCIRELGFRSSSARGFKSCNDVVLEL